MESWTATEGRVGHLRPVAVDKPSTGLTMEDGAKCGCKAGGLGWIDVSCAKFSLFSLGASRARLRFSSIPHLGCGIVDS